MSRHCKLMRFVVFLCSAFSPLAAQIPDAWQVIPKEDLALSDNPANPGSSAMILERQIYTDDQKRIQAEFVRIKILTDEGRSYADVEIPYFAKSTTVSDIRARTVHADGTVINFDGTVFDNVVIKYKKVRYDVKTFTLPGVEVGSVIEYAYTIHWKESFPDLVRNSSNYIIDGGWAYPTTTWTIQRELFTRHAVFALRPVKGAYLHWTKIRLSDSDPSSQPDGTVRMEVVNVPAIEHEEYMPDESMLNSRVHFYYAVGLYQNFWSEYGKYCAKNADKFIESTKPLQRAAAEIAPPSDPPEVRLRKLYTRVQQIRYLSYEPLKTQKEVDREHLPENKSAEDILRHGYGYGNEINFLFEALARAAGFDASIVAVVDRSTAVFEPTVYDPSQLTAMVVLVNLQGRKLYFDPATRFCPFGDLPWYENETSGVRWDKLGGVVVDVQADTITPDMIERDADLKLQSDGGLEGAVDIFFTGQEAVDRRLQARDEDESGRRKLVEDEVKEWLPAGATVDFDSIQGWDATSGQPLRVKCRVHAPRFAVLTGQRMLFPTGVFQVNRKPALPHLSRTLPVYFGHGYSQIDKIAVSLPSGYQVEALPANSTTDSKFAKFSQKRTNQNGVVHLERQNDVKQYVYGVSSYGGLWQYFQKLRKSDAENVVLHAQPATH